MFTQGSHLHRECDAALGSAHRDVWGHADTSRGNVLRNQVLVLDTQLRAGGSPSRAIIENHTKVESDVRCIEILDVLLPSADVTSDQRYVFLAVDNGNHLLERGRNTRGDRFTALIPRVKVGTDGFYSLRDQQPGLRHLYYFVPDQKQLSPRWSIELVQYNPTTDEYELYPIPDDTDPSHAPVVTLEITSFRP